MNDVHVSSSVNFKNSNKQEFFYLQIDTTKSNRVFINLYLFNEDSILDYF